MFIRYVAQLERLHTKWSLHIAWEIIFACEEFSNLANPSTSYLDNQFFFEPC